MLWQLLERYCAIGRALFSQTGWRGHCLRAISLLLPFGLFVFIAFGEFPAAVALEVRYKNPISLLGIGLILYMALRIEGWIGILAGLAAVLSVFALELAGLWLTAESDGEFIIGGLLPWSDARGYYTGAQLLEAGGELSPWYGRRPWFMSELAVLLLFTQGNLQWAIAALAAITAVACFLLARSIQALLGTAAAVAALLVLQLFYSRFIGTTTSEHLGLALGSLALTVLLQAARQDKPGVGWAMGIGLLTCALVARAGAFFVLPALVAWGLWIAWHRQSKPTFLGVVALGVGAIGAGFILDSLLRRVLVPGAVAFGNFSHTLYGLVSGNKGWMQASHDHPETMAMGDAEASQYVYELAFIALRDNPLTAVSGAIGTWQDFFSFGALGIFGFISMPTVQWAAIVLCGLGLAACLWRWRSASHSMVTAMAAGVILSVPFVPPIDAYSMRVYAATIPLGALLIAHGVTLFRFTKAPRDPLPSYPFDRTAGLLGVLLVLIIFAGAIALSLLRQAAHFQPPSCPPDETGLVMRMNRGSSLRLLENEARARSRVPDVRVNDFEAGHRVFRQWYPKLHSTLEGIQAGESLSFTINLAQERYGEPLWVISDSAAQPESGFVQACAVSIDNKAGNFYRAESLRSISGSR